MNFRILILPMVLLIPLSWISGQGNTMYYHPGIPQTYYLNPATQPRCNVFVGIPVINSFYFENENSSLHLSNLLWNDPITGEVLHPFHPNANLDDFFDHFGDENKFGLSMDFNPISFGFRIKSMYFTFDVTSKTKADFSYPVDFMKFAIEGGPDSTIFDFSGLGLHFSEHLEFALGISKQFSEQLTIGIRPKLLSGVALISAQGSDVSLFTTTEQWQFDSQFDLQLCIPGATIPTNDEGVFDPGGEFIFDSTLKGFADYRKLVLSNKGFGIDMGIHFKPVERLQLSASIIDLGFINWKKYTHTSTLEGSYNFEGITYSHGNDSVNYVGALWDSVKSNFNVSGSSGSFKTSLDPKIYVGGDYALTKRINVGILSRFDILDEGLKARVILLANWHPSTVYSLSLSYCPIGDQANTFGTAVSWRFGPVGLYTVFDYRAIKYTLYKYENIPVFLSPANRSRFSFRFGMNVVIGCNQQKKLMKDKPMYYYEEY
jgi:hypothetical protein